MIPLIIIDFWRVGDLFLVINIIEQKKKKQRGRNRARSKEEENENAFERWTYQCKYTLG